MPTYHIEKSKSGRAACKAKGCGEKIAKGEYRVGTTNMKDDHEMTAWKCLKCFLPGPKSFKQSDSDPVKWCADNLTDLRDDATVEMVLEAMEATLAKPKPAPKSPEKMLKIRAAAEANIIDDDGPKKKLKVDPSSSVSATELDAFEIYSGMKTDAIKDYLRWNDMMLKGNKDQILNKVIDAHIRGRLGRCPDCEGKVSIDEDDDEVIKCKGSWNEEAGCRVTCFNQWPKEKYPYRLPFVKVSPSDDEIEKIVEANKAAGKTGGIDGKIAVKAELVDMDDVNITTPDGLKVAVPKILQACRVMNVELPADDHAAKVACAQIVMSQKTEGVTAIDAILKAIATKFGVKKTAEQEADVASRAASSCTIAENGPFVQIFKTLSELYMKDGNFQASNTYKKAAKAINECSYLIDDEHLKHMHKPKHEYKLEGLGKAAVDYMKEFKKTGEVGKIKEKKEKLGML
ncbi:hypothetical protein TrLO_g1499 [Triparma laevis f. longispina]|uniref:PARP-type domain-containing protein n=1 Tax=Triparma laevis f. longispina TaxID=1714387 RepID=A0A9W7DZD7_9STRA|nr:hypothetical protein TrLO_g1499 [Triparma laevis f. longispina]